MGRTFSDYGRLHYVFMELIACTGIYQIFTSITGDHVDACITQTPRKPKIKPCYKVVSEREEKDDEADAKMHYKEFLNLNDLEK